jgi:hypothetical protein
VLVFDERHEVHVVIVANDEDALTGISFAVRVFQDLQEVAALDVEHDVLEPDAALLSQLGVLRVIPVEVLHELPAYHDVCS